MTYGFGIEGEWESEYVPVFDKHTFYTTMGGKLVSLTACLIASITEQCGYMGFNPCMLVLFVRLTSGSR